MSIVQKREPLRSKFRHLAGSCVSVRYKRLRGRLHSRCDWVRGQVSTHIVSLSASTVFSYCVPPRLSDFFPTAPTTFDNDKPAKHRHRERRVKSCIVTWKRRQGLWG